MRRRRGTGTTAIVSAIAGSPGGACGTGVSASAAPPAGPGLPPITAPGSRIGAFAPDWASATYPCGWKGTRPLGFRPADSPHDQATFTGVPAPLG